MVYAMENCTVKKILAITSLLCVLTLLSAAPVGAGEPAAVPAWVAGVTNVIIGGVTLGMTKAAVTNIDARYHVLSSPVNELDTTRCLLLSVPEEKLGIGNVRPGFKVDITRTVFYDQDDRAVAIEMTFSPVDIDKRNHILTQLERKYLGQPRVRKDAYKYRVSPVIELLTTVEPCGPRRTNGPNTSSDYTVRNLYYHTSQFPAAVRHVQSSNAGVFDTLL